MEESKEEFPAKEDGYDLQWPIGTGAFGLVWKAIVLEGPMAEKEVAIKIIDLA
jgi:hypothetical protein